LCTAKLFFHLFLTLCIFETCIFQKLTITVHVDLTHYQTIQCLRRFQLKLISSSVGGDPCGPMIFSLAIQPVILSVDS
jgi:hypothetical protein